MNTGMCLSWGWATWDPRPLHAALDTKAGVLPSPQALMTRAGLLVPADVLDSAQHLATMFGIGESARWGMSPFGGRADHPIWERVNPRRFLTPNQNASCAQAIFRTAFELPPVDRIAVGTDDPRHLDELLAAVELPVDQAAIARYRQLLRARGDQDRSRGISSEATRRAGSSNGPE
ncbi:hypothetical protein [Crossiella sp. S99.2]|uniref:hypothetical protein n=1 Tax=Crossiella sp. S99.2 TaxID=2936272 RepID=UPI001FFFC449|nr:hypothetical protein [Crossiella sp. S99.2]MCK2245190.1 hypothetical protein [Crossiella sp. S99.2]